MRSDCQALAGSGQEVVRAYFFTGTMIGKSGSSSGISHTRRQKAAGTIRLENPHHIF